MSHTSQPQGPRRRAGAAGESARQANIFGALSLAVAGRMQEVVEEASAHGASAPAALVALDTFLGGQPIDALRRVLGLTHSGAVRLVDRLADAGLVERRVGATGRSVALNLTPAGRRAARRVADVRQRTLAGVLDVLSPGEREQLSALHERLLAGVIGGRADARRTCRMCDADACGHWEGRCPVTAAADAAEAAAEASS